MKKKSDNVNSNQVVQKSFKSARVHTLNVSIHLVHILWITILIFNVRGDGRIADYSIFLPLLLLAMGLEILRWSLLGSRVVAIFGRDSLVSLIHGANKSLFSFSWYAIAIAPPLKFIEQYVASLPATPTHASIGELISQFVLKSGLASMLTCMVFFLCFAASQDTPVSMGGIGSRYLFACFYWVAVYAATGKSIACLLYSFFIHVKKYRYA